MDKNLILQKLIQEIIPQSVTRDRVLPDVITKDTMITEVTDSLDFVELIVNVETAFHITFEEQELMLSSFTTIDSLAELAGKKIANESVA